MNSEHNSASALVGGLKNFIQPDDDTPAGQFWGDFMRVLSFSLSVLIAGSTACIAAESIYLSTTAPLEEFREVVGLDGSYGFVAPYFTKVRTAASISISKVTSGNSNSTDPQSKTPAPSAPSVKNASWYQKQIKYAVSCDLTSVLNVADHDKIAITGSKPAGYDTPAAGAEVTLVRPDAVFIAADTDPGPYLGGSTLKGGITCPSPASANGFSVNFTLNTLPYGRAYLYLRRNALFSDSINVSVDGNGMMAGSDSSSIQQITAILTELAQTAETLIPNPRILGETEKKSGPTPLPAQSPRQICYNAISNLLKPGPFYADLGFPYIQHNKGLSGVQWSWLSTEKLENGVELVLTLTTLTDSLGGIDLFSAAEGAITGIDKKKNKKTIHVHNGLVAFFPVPAAARIYCVVGADHLLLNAPTVVNMYARSQYLDPQRDFLTGPQDSLTFSAGFIVGHKYSDQSSAKTVVDAVTAPVRALFPSVSVQQTTQVQTGGGKSDQTTTTTQRTTGPPKSQ